MNVRLGEIMTQVRGVSYKKSDASQSNGPKRLPVLRAGNIQDSQIFKQDYVYLPESKVTNKQKLRYGDVLIAASSGSLSVVGKAAMIEDNMDAAFGAFCKVLRPSFDKVFERYFKYYFQTLYYRNTIKSLAEGANINNLKTEHFDELIFPLPPLPVQKKIAAILDAADAYRQKTKALLEKYDELAQSIFLDMFGDTWLNPKKWQELQLQEVVKPKKIITYGIVQAGAHTEDGVPYIRTGDIKNGQIIEQSLRRTSKKIASSYERSRCEGGDIIMSIRATVGTCALLPDTLHGANLTQGTARISCDPSKVKKEFLLEAIRSKGIQQKISLECKGATFREITLGRLRKIEIPIPDLQSQELFVQRLSEIESQKVSLEKIIGKSENLFQSLLQRAFKGELVV